MRTLPALLLIASLAMVSSQVRAHGPGDDDAGHVHPETEALTADGEPGPAQGAASEEETGTRAVSFTGRIRLRGLFHAGVGGSGGHDHSSGVEAAHEDQTRGVLMQVRIGMSWTPYEWLAFHVEGQDAHVFGEGFTEEREAPAEHSNLFDLRKAYVDLHTTLAEAPMRVRIGRQTLHFGHGMLVADDEWLNVPLMWDAARITIGTPQDWQLDLWGSWAVARDPLGFDGHELSGHSPTDSFLHGLYLTTREVLPGADLDVYVMMRHAPDHGDRIMTLGSRLEWTSGHLHFEGEVAAQIGLFGGANHLAALAHGAVGYSFPSLLDLHLEAGLTLASGDGNPIDGIHRTFDAPYGRRADWGPMHLFGHQNLVAMTGSAEARLWEELTVRLDVGSFLLAESGDAWYDAHGHEVRHTDGETVDPYVGTQLGLAAHLPYAGWLDVAAGASYLFAGGYVAASGKDEDAAMVYLQVSARL